VEECILQNEPNNFFVFFVAKPGTFLALRISAPGVKKKNKDPRSRIRTVVISVTGALLNVLSQNLRSYRMLLGHLLY